MGGSSVWKERHEGIVPNKVLAEQSRDWQRKKACGWAPQAAMQRPRGERWGVKHVPVKHGRDSAD